MPTAPRYLLACYFDVADISLALVSQDSDNQVDFFNFPYIYSPEAFSNQAGEPAFNKAVIETFLASRKIKLSDVTVLTSGFMEVPQLEPEANFSLRLVSFVNELKSDYPFIVNSFSIMTKDAVLSYEPCLGKARGSNDSGVNELANLSIYPQLIPADIPTLTSLDKCIAEKAGSTDFGYTNGQRLTFSGSRFSRPVIYEYLDWILATDLVRKPGLYELGLDRKNAIPLLGLVAKHNPELSLDPGPYLETLGTLVNSPSDTECLLTSDVDTSQFFDVRRDNFYSVPMLAGASSTLTLKSHSLGNVKQKVVGGKLGLVVKTVNNSLFDNVRVFNDCVKQLSLCTPLF